MKQGEDVFLKAMNIIKESKRLGTSSSLSLPQTGKNVCKCVDNIQAEIFSLVKEEIEDCDPGQLDKCLKGLWKTKHVLELFFLFYF